MTLFGWDCSDFDWQRGSVDVAAAYADGIRLFTHKATEGTKVKHVHVGEAILRARVAGIPYLGVYCVPRTPGNNGHGSVVAQVRYLLDYVDAQVPWWRQHPGWFWQVDLEHWSNKNGVYDAVAPAVGVEMARLIRQATGRPVVLYAPRWAYRDTVGGDAPLWSSAYGSNPAVPYPQAYTAAGGDKGSGWAAYSGRVPLVWQFGSRTRIGNQNGCDANAIRDETAFKALFTKTMEDDMAFDDNDKAALAEVRAMLRMHHWAWTPTAEEWKTAGGDPKVYEAIGGGALVPLLRKAALDDVDEQAIVAGVLAGLSAEQIAAAIPPGVAVAVADELRSRLES